MNMLKKITVFALMATAVFAFVSCNGKNGTSTNAPTTAEGKSISIAYVTMDSVISQYQYAKDIRDKLEKDGKDAQAQMQSKANAFQTAAEDFQRKMKINAFVSQQAAESAQARVLKLQQEAQQMELQLQQTFAQKQVLMMQDMYKDVQDKIKEYNKDKKYTLILTSSGINNLLYAEESMDITDDFIKYLNSHYTKQSETEGVKTEDKK